MTDQLPHSESPPPVQDTARFSTLPNALCVGRFVGSFALLPLALAGLPFWFVGVYLVLVTSDLVDGPIARKWHQRSDLGAHLDSVADLTLNACLIAGVTILCWDVLKHELRWFVALIASYGGMQLFGFLKFRRLISYHTYIAKGSQWLAVFAAVSLVLDWSPWPFRLAVIAAVLGNLEAIAITAVLQKWRSDVGSLLRVWSAR